MPIDREFVRSVLDRHYEEICLYTSSPSRSYIDDFSSDETSASGVWKCIAGFGYDMPLEYNFGKPNLGVSAYVYLEQPFLIEWPSTISAQNCAQDYKTDFLDKSLAEDFFPLDDPRVDYEMVESALYRLGEEELGEELIQHYHGAENIDYDFYAPNVARYLRHCVEQALKAN